MIDKIKSGDYVLIQQNKPILVEPHEAGEGIKLTRRTCVLLGQQGWKLAEYVVVSKFL